MPSYSLAVIPYRRGHSLAPVPTQRPHRRCSRRALIRLGETAGQNTALRAKKRSEAAYAYASAKSSLRNSVLNDAAEQPLLRLQFSLGARAARTNSAAMPVAKLLDHPQ